MDDGGLIEKAATAANAEIKYVEDTNAKLDRTNALLERIADALQRLANRE